MGQPSIPLPWIANTRHTGLSAGPSDKLKGRISNLRSPADAMHASGCSLDAACSQVGVDCVGHRFFLGGIKAVYWTSILTHNLGWEHVKARLVTVQLSLTSSPFPTDRLWQVARNNGGGGMGTKMRLSCGAKAVTSSGRENARPMASQTASLARRYPVVEPTIPWSTGPRSSQGCANLEHNSIHNWNHQAMFDYPERFASLCYIV